MRKNFKKEYSSSNFKSPSIYIISKKWLKEWKSSTILFEKQFNEDIIDQEKTAFSMKFTNNANENYSGVPIDIFLKQNLVLNKEIALLNQETQDFFQKHFRGYCIMRPLISRNPEIIELYLKEITIFIVNNQVLKEIEFENRLFLPHHNGLLPKNCKVQEFKKKYLRGCFELSRTYGHHSNKSFKTSCFRVWRLDYTKEQMERFVLDLKENCRKCTKNYCFYQKEGNFLQENQVIELRENQTLLIDIKEKDEEFHLIPQGKETIVRCSYCSCYIVNFIHCCGDVFYCSDTCAQRDDYYHSSRCTKPLENENNMIVNFELKEDSIKGLCGLKNLGNSCYFNSAIQCLSNCYPLTEYFFNETYIEDLNIDNRLGSQGKIVKRYAEVLKNLWCEKRSVYSPLNLKSLVSQRNFGEYSQEDSHELLAFLLDMLHEDLNKAANKEENANNIPNIINDNQKNSSNSIKEFSANESWNLYLQKNNSIIVELFAGQFKSQIICPNCKKVSVTYDSYTSIPLPVQEIKYKNFETFLIFKEIHFLVQPIKFSYQTNKSLVSDLIKVIKEAFPFEIGFFIWDQRKLVPLAMSYGAKSTDSFRKELKASQATLLIYEKKKSLSKHEEVFHLYFEKEVNSQSFFSNSSQIVSISSFPRHLPVAKKLTIRELYDHLVYLFKPFFEEFMSPTKKLVEEKNKSANFFTKIFSNRNNEKSDYPFRLFKRDNSVRIVEILVSSQSLNEVFTKNEPLEIAVCFFDEQIQSLKNFENFNKMRVERTFGMNYEEKNQEKPKDIYQCFLDFTKEEKLEASDQWFCPQCKAFQNASKKFEIYNSPHFLIFQLKRFKAKKKTLYKSKITDFIECPLKDLDLGNYVLCHELPLKCPLVRKKKDYTNNNGMVMTKINKINGEKQNNLYGGSFGLKRNFFRVQPKKVEENDDLLNEDDEVVTISTENTTNKTGKNENENLLYDLIGVIEHRGSLGYGHYIAKCRNPLDLKWYIFDDEEVSEEDEKKIITNDAYILFYQRKK